MSAVDFMISPRAQRVLGAVLAEPERAFSLRELLERTGGSHSASQTQIERLIDAGVLVEEPRRGWQRALRANTHHFLYPELRSIALKTFGLVEPLRKALAPFEQNIKEAFVFGSVAKGADTYKSDIDLVVVGSAPYFELSAALLEVEREIHRPVHLNIYAEAEWQGLKTGDPVLAQIDQGAKLQVLPR